MLARRHAARDAAGRFKSTACRVRRGLGRRGGLRARSPDQRGSSSSRRRAWPLAAAAVEEQCFLYYCASIWSIWGLRLMGLLPDLRYVQESV